MKFMVTRETKWWLGQLRKTHKTIISAAHFTRRQCTNFHRLSALQVKLPFCFHLMSAELVSVGGAAIYRFGVCRFGILFLSSYNSKCHCQLHGFVVLILIMYVARLQIGICIENAKALSCLLYTSRCV